MILFFDQHFHSAAPVLEFKRGDALTLELVFLDAAGRPQQPELDSVVFGAKRKSDYRGDFVARAEGFVAGTTTEGVPHLAAPLSLDGLVLSELLGGRESVTLTGEFEFRTLAGVLSSQTLDVIVHNDVIKGLEGADPATAPDYATKNYVDNVVRDHIDTETITELREISESAKTTAESNAQTLEEAKAAGQAAVSSAASAQASAAEAAQSRSYAATSREESAKSATTATEKAGEAATSAEKAKQAVETLSSFVRSLGGKSGDFLLGNGLRLVIDASDGVERVTLDTARNLEVESLSLGSGVIKAPIGTHIKIGNFVANPTAADAGKHWLEIVNLINSDDQATYVRTRAINRAGEFHTETYLTVQDTYLTCKKLIASNDILANRKLTVEGILWSKSDGGFWSDGVASFSGVTNFNNLVRCTSSVQMLGDLQFGRGATGYAYVTTGASGSVYYNWANTGNNTQTPIFRYDKANVTFDVTVNASNGLFVASNTILRLHPGAILQFYSATGNYINWQGGEDGVMTATGYGSSAFVLDLPVSVKKGITNTTGRYLTPTGTSVKIGDLSGLPNTQYLEFSNNPAAGAMLGAYQYSESGVLGSANIYIPRLVVYSGAFQVKAGVPSIIDGSLTVNGNTNINGAISLNSQVSCKGLLAIDNYIVWGTDASVPYLVAYKGDDSGVTFMRGLAYAGSDKARVTFSATTKAIFLGEATRAIIDNPTPVDLMNKAMTDAALTKFAAEYGLIKPQ